MQEQQDYFIQDNLLDFFPFTTVLVVYAEIFLPLQKSFATIHSCSVCNLALTDLDGLYKNHKALTWYCPCLCFSVFFF